MDEEEVPDPPRCEELLDSQEDITEVELDKVVNQNVPSEGQDTTKEKNFVINTAYQEMKKRNLKKRGQNRRKLEVNQELKRAPRTLERINTAYQKMKKRNSKQEKRQKKRKQEVCPCALVFTCFMWRKPI